MLAKIEFTLVLCEIKGLYQYKKQTLRSLLVSKYLRFRWTEDLTFIFFFQSHSLVIVSLLAPTRNSSPQNFRKGVHILMPL